MPRRSERLDADEPKDASPGPGHYGAPSLEASPGWRGGLGAGRWVAWFLLGFSMVLVCFSMVFGLFFYGFQSTDIFFVIFGVGESKLCKQVVWYLKRCVGCFVDGVWFHLPTQSCLFFRKARSDSLPNSPVLA